MATESTAFSWVSRDAVSIQRSGVPSSDLRELGRALGFGRIRRHRARPSRARPTRGSECPSGGPARPRSAAVRRRPCRGWRCRTRARPGRRRRPARRWPAARRRRRAPSAPRARRRQRRPARPARAPPASARSPSRRTATWPTQARITSVRAPCAGALRVTHAPATARARKGTGGSQQRRQHRLHAGEAGRGQPVSKHGLHCGKRARRRLRHHPGTRSGERMRPRSAG